MRTESSISVTPLASPWATCGDEPVLSSVFDTRLRRIATTLQGRAVRTGPQRLLVFSGGSAADRYAAADALGMHLGAQVRLVGKYIGETEKNLTRLFAEAGRAGWILFFDEADALFGRRTDVKDSHDRYAGKPLVYLSDCANKYRCVAILATHLPAAKLGIRVRQRALVVDLARRSVLRS